MVKWLIGALVLGIAAWLYFRTPSTATSSAGVTPLIQTPNGLFAHTSYGTIYAIDPSTQQHLAQSLAAQQQETAVIMAVGGQH